MDIDKSINKKWSADNTSNNRLKSIAHKIRAESQSVLSLQLMNERRALGL